MRQSARPVNGVEARKAQCLWSQDSGSQGKLQGQRTVRVSCGWTAVCFPSPETQDRRNASRPDNPTKWSLSGLLSRKPNIKNLDHKNPLHEAPNQQEKRQPVWRYLKNKALESDSGFRVTGTHTSDENWMNDESWSYQKLSSVHKGWGMGARGWRVLHA